MTDTEPTYPEDEIFDPEDDDTEGVDINEDTAWEYDEAESDQSDTGVATLPVVPDHLAPPIPLDEAFSVTSLNLPRKRLDFRTWVQLGDAINLMDTSSQWWLGDWMLYGDKKYGEEASQGLDERRHNPKTLSNCAYVSRRIPVAHRRDDLTWTHHRIVSDLEDEKLRFRLLRKASKEQLTTRELQRAVNVAKGKVDDDDPGDGAPKVNASFTFTFTVQNADRDWGEKVAETLETLVVSSAQEDGVELVSHSSKTK